MNKPVKINEVEKTIRKRLKDELPNCKFAVRTRVNTFNASIDIHYGIPIQWLSGSTASIV